MTLKELRLSKNLTQLEAANLLGISRKTYFNYEQGKIDANSIKYKSIIDALQQVGTLDENHGILSLEQIKSICRDVFKEYPVEYCYLFGSYAKGKANESSDIDLLVSTPIKGIGFFGLIEALRETLCKKIDLLDVAQLENNASLVQEILKDGIKIYG